MTTHSNTGLYAEDLYCSNPNNLIDDEVQTLQTPGLDDYYFIIPHAAPYYVETLILLNHATGVPYVEGVDYVPGHYFVDAMESLKRPIAGSIRILRRQMFGNVRLVYHTVGGQWGHNSQAILQELSSKQLNPIVRSWEQIDGLPARFPTISHDQSVDHLVGSDDIMQAINGIADAVEAAAAGSSEGHISSRDNPHEVTALQVGLGQVQNLPLATLVEALSTNFAAGYMTPRTTYHAINTFALTPLNQHTTNKSNPHEVTKLQVGLGNTPNLPLANTTQATDPLNNAALMSPYTTMLMIQAVLPIDRIDNLEVNLQAFIDRRDNPHQVTAAQVGALTAQETQDLITGAGSGDAIRFGGYTIEQLMDLVVEEDELIGFMQEEALSYATQSAAMAEVEPTLEEDLTQLDLERQNLQWSELSAGAGGYTVSNENNEGLLYHNLTNASGATHPVGSADSVALLDPWLYMVGADGGVYHYGGAPAVENTYSGGHPLFEATNAAQAIFTTRTARYIHTQDNRLIRSTGPAHAVLLSDNVQSVWTNTEYSYPGEMVVYQTDDNELSASGATPFVNSFNTIKAGWELDTVSDICITDTHLAVLFAEEILEEVVTEVKLYAINREGLISLTPVVYTGENPRAISGSYGHLGIALEDGSVDWFGTLSACEDEVDIKVADLACGAGFTVFLDDRGNIECWGDSAGNEWVFNQEVMYEYA